MPLSQGHDSARNGEDPAGRDDFTQAQKSLRSGHGSSFKHDRAKDDHALSLPVDPGQPATVAMGRKSLLGHLRSSLYRSIRTTGPRWMRAQERQAYLSSGTFTANGHRRDSGRTTIRVRPEINYHRFKCSGAIMIILLLCLGIRLSRPSHEGSRGNRENAISRHGSYNPRFRAGVLL